VVTSFCTRIAQANIDFQGLEHGAALKHRRVVFAPRLHAHTFAWISQLNMTVYPQRL